MGVARKDMKVGGEKDSEAVVAGKARHREERTKA